MAVKCPKCQAENPDTKQFCGDCGTPLPTVITPRPEVTETLKTPVQELATGSTFAGRYQVIEELGKGGMGKVYKVFDTKIKEKIALKLIKPEVASDRETIERFSNELRLSRKVRHKNVCGMFDLGEAEGSYFITMEYVPGEDLKSMIRMAAGLSVGAVLSIGKQVCDGLAEAHSLGVVHRDLKPQNIMIDKGGNAKIMDFGIARSVREKGITGPSVLIGTPEYMSPEQAEAKEVDQRSDIYSLGIILYEMATGRVPFEGDTALSIAMKHKGEIPKNPKQFNPNIPDSLSGVILKCLEKDKAIRYQTAADVSSELDKIEKGIPSAEVVIPKPKSITSKEITVKFSLRKLLIPGLAAAVLIIAALAIVRRAIPHKASLPAKSAKYSIAVLPFEDLSPTKDHEYLCDGMAETLINSLNNIKDLWVPARSSSFSFKGKNLSSRQIGQQLGVDNLLEASVQVIGNRLRITPKIINVEDGSQVWSDLYDRQMQDVFSIQDEIAREIVKALKIRILGEKEIPLIKSYTKNTEAYQLYLKGRFFLDKRTGENFRKAIDCFEQSLKREPNYAPALAGLADSYNLMASYCLLSPKEALPKARAAALKAFEIDNSLAEASTSLAYAELLDWDWSKAEKEFKRAIDLNPNYATAHLWLGGALLYQGRFQESLKEYIRAQELDPLSLYISGNFGVFYFQQGTYDQAIAVCNKALEVDPNFAQVHIVLARSYAQKSLFEQAVSECQKALNLFEGNWYYYAEMGSILAAAGNRKEAQKYLERVLEKSSEVYIDKTSIALIYAGLGQDEKVCDWLEKAFEEHAFNLRYLKTDPRYSRVRTNPRVISILKRIGLE